MLGEAACCNMLRSMKRLQSPFKRTVVLDGHKTSINVEPEYWDQLRLITLERQTTMAKLITEIDRIGRLLPPQGPGRHRVRTLSAAIRIFVLQESWPGLIIRLNMPPSALQRHIVHIRQPIVRHDDAHPATSPNCRAANVVSTPSPMASYRERASIRCPADHFGFESCPVEKWTNRQVGPC